ncbi:hypothetical protein [Streptomyces platensis]|uniref:hypothetical protein n=1 Tax=Streptomyces platensis TaxID=58346 RepID=UPI002F9173AF|nr:hypothetical protein OG962_37395 [Streptomyces platensis]
MVAQTPQKGRAAPPTPPPKHVTQQAFDAAQKAIPKLEHIGKVVTGSLVTIGFGALIFTCVNVTLFATSHGIPGWVAWMLDPLASLALITCLYVDGVLTEQGGYKASGWPLVLRWFAGLATWTMNCWTSLYPSGHVTLVPHQADPGGILLHSVAPVLLIALAEASSGYRAYLAKRLGHWRGIITTFETQKHQEAEGKAQRAREEAERERTAKREEAESERSAQREREEREHNARIERDRRAAEIEAKREEAAIEAERRRAENEEAERKRQAEIEAARATAAIERERAEIEARRKTHEAEIERKRKEEAARLEADAKDREARRKADIIRAEGQAKALEEKAQAEARALEEKARTEARLLEEAERAKRQAAQERAAKREARRSGDASESTRRPASISGGRSSETASKNGGTLLAIPSPHPSESASENGRVPREVRERQRDEAERYVAKCLLNNETPDLDALANRYGKGETWVGDRVRTANKRLAEEPGFEESVIEEAITLLDSAASSAA